MSRPLNCFVLVAGPPGSGKTTLAMLLAPELGLPLIGKDVIKEALMDALGTPTTVQESQNLGGAALKAMFAVARTTQGAVLESNFRVESIPELETLPGQIVEIRCCCARELALARYRSRAAHRHPGHLDSERDDGELWNAQLVRPLGIGTVIEVDTTAEVDIKALARQVEALAP